MPLLVAEEWGTFPPMTEQRWVSETVDIREMIHFVLSNDTDPVLALKGPTAPATAAINPVMSKRKQTLFMCACTRESKLWSNWRDCQMIEGIEGFVDIGKYPTDVETKVVNWGRLKRHHKPFPRMRVAIMREIVPNPFTHIVLRPRENMPPLTDHLGRRLIVYPREWATPNVLHAASKAYQYAHTGTDVFVNLATHLVHAGCQDERLLSHLRSPRRHYKGCWVVDLLLGKE